MRASEILAANRQRVLGIVEAHGARNVRVFGSVLRGADKEGSDVDLLVDMPAGTSLFDIAGLQLELQDALGIKVDLCTEGELHLLLKDEILAEARPL
ncbi:MAG: nucleotidyltransferase [Betaproteobacteria bacterium RIFCSPLOWO2_02_FULL_66_14]|nr:MAG: nucleotidyltransferase [Betaproteobacteria bacterium RIFCSPLOWO2_02_FULL_66_14]